MDINRAEKILSIIDGGLSTDPEEIYREEQAVEEDVMRFCIEKYQERGYTQAQAEEAATRDYLDWRDKHHLPDGAA